MNTILRPALLAASLAVFTTPLPASEVDHYEGKKAETLTEAVAHFSEYNRKLASILEQDEIGAEDMERIHQLTYTIENAIGKMNSEIDNLAATLEEIHLASERRERDTVSAEGEQYISKARELVP